MGMSDDFADAIHYGSTMIRVGTAIFGARMYAQTDKIVMYGDGNSTKLVSDVMNSTSQIMEGMKESTGIDLSSLLAGFVGGKAAANSEAPKE